MAEPQPRQPSSQPFTHELIHAFADYMEALRSEGGCVRFSDVNLMDIYKIVSNIYIFDIDHKTGEWIFRFFGTKLAEDFGKDLTGREVHSVIQGDTKDSILDEFIRVIDKKKPVWMKNAATPVPEEGAHNSGLKTIAYERIAYPLFGDTDRVDHVIGLAVIYPYSREPHTTQVIELS